jgi:hypothetical protein
VISISDLRAIAKARLEDAEVLARNDRLDDAQYLCGYSVEFALLEREDLSDRWDLVVSASWAKWDEATLRYVAEAIKRHLAPDEMILLARIVILEAGRDPVRAITEAYDVEHGRVELVEPSRFGLPVKHGYIITSRRVAAAA